MRNHNSPRLDLFDYLFEKNQASAAPAKREDFYNIAQEIWAELEIIFNKEGAEQVFKKLGIRYRNGKPSYGKVYTNTREYGEQDFNGQSINKLGMTPNRIDFSDNLKESID